MDATDRSHSLHAQIVSSSSRDGSVESADWLWSVSWEPLSGPVAAVPEDQVTKRS